MSPHPTADHNASDLAAIRQAALDYMQGWYEADVDRSRACLHPELAKRAVLLDPQTGEERLSHLSQPDMLAKIEQGGGSADVPAGLRYYEVSILEVYGDIACARAESYEYIDYLQLARWEGTWRIVNVLWALNLSRR